MHEQHVVRSVLFIAAAALLAATTMLAGAQGRAVLVFPKITKAGLAIVSQVGVGLQGNKITKLGN